MNNTSSVSDRHAAPVVLTVSIPSKYLKRQIVLSLILPGDYESTTKTFPLVLFQDGQDFPALHLLETVEKLVIEGKTVPTILVGIHANENRIYEYGIASQADYKGRGTRAGAHSRFVVEELLPYLTKNFPVRPDRHVIAGFSLGGLMALDIAWNHSDRFSKTGVFSGSLWWRRKAFGAAYDDSDRIMHRQIADTSAKPDLKFWFQTGTNDETSDRDNDGVIDSISDTLDCIAELERKGYRWKEDIRYLEIKGGEHRPQTWAQAMADFLEWSSGKL